MLGNKIARAVFSLPGLLALVILILALIFGAWIFYESFYVLPRNERNVGPPGTIVFLNDGPHESMLVVRQVTTSEISGTLYITLPEGSSDPDIDRYSKTNGVIIWPDPCVFMIDYTTQEGTRTTLTWGHCSHFQGVEVHIDEIVVSVP